ncbi:MAG TPA: VWA domain-containing protein [Myxococcota bacterium]|nr:VWA domain-containing protein [Myxococcota bacterium]HNZ02567.1 VWA domain-containing protein [Myxococcota bacterium]HOD06463.1 VWA domain-containing protein [Myxococcota bacterium]HPB51360.1 VWA domain-containing protein [Myxococcota bacterium]HQP96367.1 VWA domain-containing protein [Myxococcota bacterium]
MRFDSPLMLLLLIPLAAVVAFGLFRLFRRPAHLRFPTVVHANVAGRGLRARLAMLPQIMIAVGLAFAILALARPQVRDPENLRGEGVDFVIALDMSSSMNAVDVSMDRIKALQAIGREPPNRFETARKVLKDFIASREFDRVGLIIFSTHAWVKFPLTLDRNAVAGILDGLILDNGLRNEAGQCTNGCTIMGDSTAIGDALARSFKRLEESDTASRNIILITDGDNNAGSATPSSIAEFIAKESAERPVKVFSFLIGDNEDTYWQAINPMTGRQMVGPDGLKLYQPTGREVTVNPDLLQEIADLTGGKLYVAPSAKDFIKDFGEMEKTEFSAPAISNFKEAFAWPLGLAIFFCLTGALLSVTVLRRWP